MADNDNFNPATDLLNEKSANTESERARRINSLHRTVDDLVQEQNKKRLQVSTEVSTLTKQQQKMMAQLELERGEITTDTARGYSNVLKGLGRTIDSLATGVKNITVDTGKATSDAISQYGRAIGEDVSMNKTNTIAMSLSRATPLFGYFAAKFMETDVFKNAARGIRERVGGAMKDGLSKAGSGISNIFKRGKEAVAEDKKRSPATVSDLAELRKDMDLPQLQKGGYIKEGGVVEVHAAEVVAPIDKILKEIDKAKNADISRKLDKTLSIMSQNLMRLETIVVQRDEKQKGLVGTFVQEFQNAKNIREQSWQERMLKAILELKVGLIGMTSRIRIAWQRTLLQHPTFRNLLMFSDLIKGTMLSPIKFLFGVRGGYAGDVRGATRTSNVYLKTSNLLAMTYTTLMPKMDDIVLYTKATAEALVGGPVEGAQQQGYTMFGKIQEMLTTRSIQSPGEKMFDMFVDRLGLDKGALGDAGVTGLGGFANPLGIMRKMGATEENIGGTMFEGPGKPVGESKIFQAYTEGKAKAKNVFEYMAQKLGELTGLKKDQEEREGPHSPSMAENISRTADFSEENYEQIKDSGKKTDKFQKSQLSFSKKAARRLRKLKSKLWDWILFGFTFIKDFFFKGIGMIKSFLQPLVTAALTAGGGALAKLGGGAALAGGASIAAGVAMGVYDGMRAVAMSDEWKTSKASAAVGGFLGGTDKGASGAAKGALKGGLIGAGIGSFFPVVGTAIGGAIGAIAGGVLGFIGGKNIAQGIDALAGYLKKFIMAAWGIIKWPFEMIGKGFTWLKENLTWENVKKWAEMGWDKYWAFITWPYRKAWEGIEWVYAKAKELMTESWLGKKVMKIIDFLTWPHRKIAEMFGKVKDFFMGEGTIQEKAMKIFRFVTWPHRKISELFGKVKAFFMGEGSTEEKVKKIISFITWPMRKIMELRDWAKEKIKALFSDTWLGKQASKISSFISWPMDKIRELKDAALDWIDKKFGAGTSEKAVKAVTDMLTAPYDSLMSVFSWFGNLFDKIKEWAASKIKNSWLGRFFSDDEIDTPPAKKISSTAGIPENYKIPRTGTQEIQTPRSKAVQRALEAEAEIRAAEEFARQKGMAALGDHMGKTIENGQNRTTAAVMQNTNIMASSHNSSVVGGGSGGLPSGYMNFASGANFASDVTKCNIK